MKSPRARIVKFSETDYRVQYSYWRGWAEWFYGLFGLGEGWSRPQWIDSAQMFYTYDDANNYRRRWLKAKKEEKGPEYGRWEDVDTIDDYGY